MTTQITINSQRSVSFRSKVKVRNTMHLNDYTEDEMASCWYSKHEIEMIREEIRIILTIIDGNSSRINNYNDRICSRGLESFSIEGSTKKQEARMNSRDVVLAATRQRYYYYDDSNRIPFL